MHNDMLFALAMLIVCCLPATAQPVGPIAAPGAPVAVTAEGVRIRGGRMPVPPAPPSAWNAEWIWLPAGAPHAPVGLFRKVIDLPGAPRRADFWLSADLHYRLYVNGALVSRGPADPGADYPSKRRGTSGITFCDHRDLTANLHLGRNVIAAEVFAEPPGPVEWWTSGGAPGLFCQGRISTAGGVVEVRTDASWLCAGAESFQGPVWRASGEPAGWRGERFAAGGWKPAGPAGRHWPRMLPSELPPPMEVVYPFRRVERVAGAVEMPARPFKAGAAVAMRGDGGFALVFDRVLSGYVALRVRGGAGARLSVGMAETGEGGHRRFTLDLDGGEHFVESPFYSSFAVLNVQATGVTSPLTIEEVRAVYTSMPVRYRGSFACSDPALTRTWDICRWLTQICLQDRHLDSPDHQEPIGDFGDYAIEYLNTSCAFGESPLARQDLRKFAAILRNTGYVTFHTSYSLLWLRMLLDYYDRTGDVALVKEMAPTVDGLLDRFTGWRGKNGLISEAPDYMFMDWVELAGFSLHHPPAVIGQGYLTAFYYQALADGGRVARIAGEGARAARYEELRGEVKAAFNGELWSAEKGLYRDGRPGQSTVPPGEWLPADRDIETFSPQVNTLAVLCGLAPAGRRAAIMRQVIGPPPSNCQPYFMHYVFGALAQAGLFDTAGTAQMRRWTVNESTRSFSEMWGQGDLSHAWQCTPLYQLSTRVLGIAPAAPGWRRIRIEPALCDLAFARGAVPTPRGPVAVDWALIDGGWRCEVTVPPSCSARVAPPLARFPGARVMLDGKPARVDAPLAVGPGRHHIVIRRGAAANPPR